MHSPLAICPDLIAGRDRSVAFRTAWPTDDPGLSRADNLACSACCSRADTAVGVADGLIGARTRDAIRAEQARLGMPVTGRAEQRLLAALRGGRRTSGAGHVACSPGSRADGATYPERQGWGRRTSEPRIAAPRDVALRHALSLKCTLGARGCSDSLFVCENTGSTVRGLPALDAHSGGGAPFDGSGQRTARGAANTPSHTARCPRGQFRCPGWGRWFVSAGNAHGRGNDRPPAARRPARSAAAALVTSLKDHNVTTDSSMSSAAPGSDLREAPLEYHRDPVRGKISVNATKPLSNQRDLSLAYSPRRGVSCLDIQGRSGLCGRSTPRAAIWSAWSPTARPC